MEMIKKGDICKVKKSKYLASGSQVKVVRVLDESILLCSAKDGSFTVIVSGNLEGINGDEHE